MDRAEPVAVRLAPVPDTTPPVPPEKNLCASPHPRKKC
jgi:hypothetical protein